MLVNGERLGQNCPVTGRFDETGWNMQCPMANQWENPINNVHYIYPVPYTNRQNFNNDPSVQCFSGVNRVTVSCYPENRYTNPYFEEMKPNLQNHSEGIPNPAMPCYNGKNCDQYADNFVVEPSQCYQQNNIPGYSEVPTQYYPARRVFRPPNYLRAPIMPNLPCQQTQPWDYDMCFNVDGQPCQYTAVVDLEDFMNNEKRKEKSRVAARCRRNKEMEIFSELTAALPAKKEEVEQLDKASVMRLAISYLRVRDVVSLLPIGDHDQPALQNPKGLEEVSSELSYMKALDGFVLVLSQQGDIVYCSENIADHLGVSQMEIMGQSVFEFSHPCDHEEIREALRSNGAGKRDLLIRLKCTLTSKGRNVHLKSASYKVVHVTGHMLTPENKVQGNTEDVKVDKKSGTLVAVGRPIPHPSNIEIPLDSKTFLSKHSLDMKFTYTDDTLTNTLGFLPDELIGQSLYDYHHAADSASLGQQFKSLFSKGQCETGQYRFLAKTGGYSWVQTQATVITDKQQKPISIVCVNFIISGIECKDEVFAAHQVQHADVKPPVALSAPVQLPPLQVPSGAIVATILPEDERPIPVTELIFAPRKKEMNKGFLMFSQDAGSTMLKDEPEDLTHLAPTAGDACIPLEDSPFDMFDEFILGDNYCSLLGDDLTNGSPVDSLTPDHLLSSPDPNETESSCEQSSLLTDLSIDAFDSGRSDNDIDDGNSPFIPSSDELPMLETAVMWGALPDNVSMARPQPTEIQASPAPALQRLLAAPATGPPPQDLITNIYSDQGLIPSRSVSSWDTGVKRVLKQEEEPCAKRVKRSPSPQRTASSTPSTSVLMNLLDLPQLSQAAYQPNQKSVQPFRMDSIPVSVMNELIQNKQTLAGNLIRNSISPLSLNIDSPMYSLPSSPNTFSPAQKHVLSAYATPESLSPSSYTSSIINDPFLTQKMQPSPNYPMAADFLGSNTELWGDAEMLAAFDDAVKLV